MSADRDIAEFFRAYVDAFSRDDLDGLCRLWLFPALIMTPTGNVILEEAPFRANGARLMTFYRAQGMASAEVHAIDIELLYAGAAKARVGYRLSDASGGEIAAWEHVYVLRKTPAGWRAAATVADGEIAAWSARGTPLGG